MVSLRLSSWPSFALLAGASCAAWWLGAMAPCRAADTKPDFVKQIRPILAEHCIRCHGPEKQQSGLRLDSKERAFQGGDSGEPAIVPGKPDNSLMIVYIRGDDPDVFMPPEGDRVPEKQQKLLIEWIKAGAVWPSESGDK